MMGNNGSPQGWDVVTVGDHVKNISLTGKKLKQKEYQETGKYPVIDQGQLFIGGYTDNSDFVLDIKDPVIVFGDHTKAIKYVDFDFVPGADGVKVLKPSEIFYPKLFYYFVQAVQLPDKGYARHYQYLAKAQIPVPPRPEQERIVARIEETFTQLEAGIAELQNAKAQLKRYRAAVLKSAMEGELTREWREAHQGEIEPAEKLLARILSERRAKWEAEGGKGKYKEPVAPDIDGLPKLPDGWVWVSLGQLLEKIEAGKSFKAEGRPAKADENGVIKVSAMSWGKFLPEENKALFPDTDISKSSSVKAGDLLISRANTVELVGAIVLVERDYPNLYLSDKSLRLVLSSGDVDKRYVLYSLRSQWVRNVYEKLATGTSDSMRNLAQGKIMSAPIALPSFDEQKRIADKLERRLSVADEIEKELDESLVRAERLRGSVLKNAFEGKLV